MGDTAWFANLDLPRRREDLLLWKPYSPEAHPKCDHCDAIDASKTKEMPMDYAGVMGAPIAFLDKRNPDPFEIRNANDFKTHPEAPDKPRGLIQDEDGSINGKPAYARIFRAWRFFDIIPVSSPDYSSEAGGFFNAVTPAPPFGARKRTINALPASMSS